MSKKQSHITKRRREQVALLAFSGQGLSLAQIAEQIDAMGIPCSPPTVMRDLEFIEKGIAVDSEVDMEELRGRAIAQLEAKISELADLKDRAPHKYYDLWLKYRVELHRVLGVRAASKVDITVSKKPFQQMSELELLAALLDRLNEAQFQRVMEFITSMQPEEEGPPLLEGEVEEKEGLLGLPRPHRSFHE